VCDSLVLIADLLANAQYEEALAEADRTLLFAPQDGSLHLARGRALESRGRAAEAAEEYQAALDCAPENKDACAAIGVLAQKHGDIRAAETALARAVELDPSDSGIARELAAVRVQLAALWDTIQILKASLVTSAPS